jgi:outer membrane protein OmpA-like peptidoglycan-associated protein
MYKNVYKVICALFLLLILLIGCQTFTKKTEETPEVKVIPSFEVSLSAANKIINPNSKESKLSSQVFKVITKGNVSTNINWKFDVKDEKESIVYTAEKAGALPSELFWDGKVNNKEIAKDGKYFAEIVVTYGQTVVTKNKSELFLLDTTPPDISIDREPKYFSPDDDDINDILTITFNTAYDLSGIKNWELIIMNPVRTKEFFSFNGAGKPGSALKWDGKSKDDVLVESVEEYPVIIKAEDMVGNVLEKEADPILIDILVIKLKDGRYKIRISNIKFKADSAEMTDSPKNAEVLGLLANALKKYEKNKILIEGYANRYKERLDEKVALELSEARARAIVDKLVEEGIDSGRMTIKGRGFDNPIIPLKKKMTKEESLEMEINRRVEFYLDRN